MNSRLPHYLIVGGGLSGLSTAYFLSLAKPIGSCRITVLEKSNRWGGWIQSIKSAKTGSTYELGPHSARASSGSSNLLLRLASDLGLRDSIIWMSRDQDVGRQLIYANGHLIPFSALSPSTAQPFTRSPLSLVLKRILTARPPRQEDWTVDEFLRTRLDGQFADYLGSAIMRGIFGGDSRQLSARACIPTLVEAETRGPNLILGLLRSVLKPQGQGFPLPCFLDSCLPQITNMPPRTFAWSLSTGMQALPDALVEKLTKLGPQVSLQLNSHVNAVQRLSSHFEVEWERDSDSHRAKVDAVFMCCPSYKAVKLLNGSISPNLLNLIDKPNIPWTNIVAVVLELAPPADPPLRGFGHLVPLKEDPYILGIIYDSVALPSLSGSTNAVRYTVMMKPRPEWLESMASGSNEVLSSIEMTACSAIKQQLQIANPVVLDRQIAILRDCIPQYALNHKKRITNLRDGIQDSLSLPESSPPGLHFVGYSYDGVGLTDVVHSALKAVIRELKLN